VFLKVCCNWAEMILLVLALTVQRRMPDHSLLIIPMIAEFVRSSKCSVPECAARVRTRPQSSLDVESLPVLFNAKKLESTLTKHARQLLLRNFLNAISLPPEVVTVLNEDLLTPSRS
jgi:hypothetical protein